MTVAEVVETDQEGQKALAEGFESSSTDGPAKGKPAADAGAKQEKPKEAADKAKPEAGSEEGKPAGDPPPEHVQLTKRDFDLLMGTVGEVASFKRQLASAHGNIGHLTKTLNELSAKMQTGEPIDPNDEDFAELLVAYPELAQSIRAGLSRHNKRAHAARSTPKKEADKTPQANDPDAEKEAAGKREEALVAEEYPDWVKIIGRPEETTNEFRQWLNAQPEDYRERLNKTRQGIVIIRALDKFHTHKETASSRREEPNDKKPETPARSERLREAVQPRGDGGVGRSSSKTEEQQLMEGFAS